VEAAARPREDEDDRRPARRRDEEEDRPRSRRSREDDYDDRPARVATRTEEGNGAALGLGIAALCCGSVGLILNITCVGAVVGLPLSGLGVVLGLVGLILAWVKEWRGVGFPIAGSAVSIVGAAVGLIFVLWVGTAFWQFGKQVQQQAQQAKQQAEKDAQERYDRDRQTLRGQGFMDVDKNETAVIDGIEVRVVSAQVGVPNLRLAGRQHNVGNRLIINLAIKNTSQRNRLYQGWGNTASLMLDSSRSISRARIENGVEVVGQQKNVTIAPGQTINDVLVFEVPDWSYDANWTNSNTPSKKVLRLDLPGAAFGVGNNARFQIPESSVPGR
jgi:hypothetical protein